MPATLSKKHNLVNNFVDKVNLFWESWGVATYTDQTKRALKISETATSIIKALDPLSDRSKRRVLMFFFDLVQDPAEECTFAQLEILKEVAVHLGVKNVI